jgi:hypothetical protein
VHFWKLPSRAGDMPPCCCEKVNTTRGANRFYDDHHTEMHAETATPEMGRAPGTERRVTAAGRAVELGYGARCCQRARDQVGPWVLLMPMCSLRRGAQVFGLSRTRNESSPRAQSRSVHPEALILRTIEYNTED